MSLGGLIPDLQLLITVEGVGGKEKKKKKKAPVFQERGVIHTRCGGSESSWSFLGGGSLHAFSFPKAVPQSLHQDCGERRGLSVAAAVTPVPSQHSPGAPGPWHCCC